MAQVNLIIEDATNTGFLLGINGYVQNTDPVKELVVKKLDTFPFNVRVELSPNVFFEKKMHFHTKGNYQYIITTNSRDELQLRFRGEADVLPATATTIDAKNATPLRPLASISPTKEKPATVIPEKKPVAKAPTATAAKTIATPAPAKSPVAKINIPKAAPPKTETIAAVKKDTVVALVTPPPPPPVKKEKTFVEFYAELQETEFEFEKLNAAQQFGKKHSYTVEELKKILAAMKYDNTRLEFIRATKEQWKNLNNIQSLRDSFEYEISKEQFNDLTL